MKKDILIIGGMGPQAGLTLHQKIISSAISAGAKHGDDFPAITHISIPVPEFIDSNSEIVDALSVIKEHLYCFWRQRVFTHSYSV